MVNASPITSIDLLLESTLLLSKLSPILSPSSVTPFPCTKIPEGPKLEVEPVVNSTAAFEGFTIAAFPASYPRTVILFLSKYRPN